MDSCLPPIDVNSVSCEVAVRALFIGSVFVGGRGTKHTATFTKTIGSIDEAIGFIRGRRNDTELTFLLNHHGENLIDRRKGIYKQDLGTYNRKTFIQSFQESNDKILVVIFLSLTRTGNKRMIIIQFLPEGFQGSVKVRDKTVTLRKAIYLFLELWNAEKISL